jgi:SAM-dependent methyltransferase
MAVLPENRLNQPPEIESPCARTAPAPPRTAEVGVCPLCGADDSVVLYRMPDRLHGTPGEFTYRRCTSCRTVFQDPRVVPEDLGLCYPRTYFTHSRPSIPASSTAPGSHPLIVARDTLRRAIVASVRGEPTAGWTGLLGRVLARSRWLRERAFYDAVMDELLPRAIVSQRALDVGCGAGDLLRALQCVGWAVEGVEWDPAAADMAREVTGLCITQGDFRHLDLPLGVYGLVVLHHVYEHLDEPVAALSRIADLLAPGGHAVLVYPNPDSLGARLFRDCWFAWEAPRHLVLPPGLAVSEAALRLGSVRVQVSTITRSASEMYLRSAAYRSGVWGDHPIPRAGWVARLFGFAETAAASLGFRVGEETVVTLTKKAVEAGK